MQLKEYDRVVQYEGKKYGRKQDGTWWWVGVSSAHRITSRELIKALEAVEEFDIKYDDGGTFKLERDVKNPHPDKRAKYDRGKHPVWKAGTRYRVTNIHAVLYGEKKPEPTTIQIRFLDGGGLSSNENEEGVKALLENSVAFEDVALLLERNHFSNGGTLLLQRLVDAGKISLDDIRDAIRQQFEEDA